MPFWSPLRKMPGPSSRLATWFKTLAIALGFAGSILATRARTASRVLSLIFNCFRGSGCVKGGARVWHRKRVLGFNARQQDPEHLSSARDGFVVVRARERPPADIQLDKRYPGHRSSRCHLQTRPRSQLEDQQRVPLDQGVRRISLMMHSCSWSLTGISSPHFFKSCKISAIALIKMVRHPRLESILLPLIRISLGHSRSLWRNLRDHGAHARPRDGRLSRCSRFFRASRPGYRNASQRRKRGNRVHDPVHYCFRKGEKTFSDNPILSSGDSSPVI